MPNNDKDEFGNEDLPKTIESAITLWLSQNSDFTETELIIETPQNRLDWLHNNLRTRIIELFDLKNNAALREDCGSKNMNPDEAAKIITGKLWKYWNPG